MIIAAHPVWERHYRVTTTREDLARLARTVCTDDMRDPSDAAPTLMAKISWARAHGQPLPVIEIDHQELELLLAAAGAPA